MKTKKWFFFVLFILSIKSFGQNNDLNLIPIAVVIPEQVDYSNVSINELLGNKLSVIISKYGMTDKMSSPRFVIFPKISLLDKEFSKVPPIQNIINIEVDIFVADYIDNKKFGSVSLKYKGVGESEEKAYRNALKNFSDNDKFEIFIKEAKQRILDYYNINCDKIIMEANVQSKQNNFNNAINILSQIPVSSECFPKAQDALITNYQNYTNQKCNENLQSAKASFAKNDISSSLDYLSNIFPNSTCYNEAQLFYKEIKVKAKKLEDEYKAEIKEDKKIILEERNKEWNLLMKQYELTLTEYQNEKLFKQRIIELSFDVAKEKAKADSEILRKQQNNSILLIK